MTKLFTVDLDTINCDKPRSEFSAEDLETVAKQILAIDGNVKTIVLKKVGFENYEVVDGHFEYYAALRASEINIAQSEVNAVVISPEQEEAAKIQIKTIKPSPAQVTQTQTNTGNIASTSQDIAGLLQRLNEIEKRLDKTLTNFRDEQQEIKRNIDSRLNKFEEKLPKPIDALKTFNESDIDILVNKLSYVRLSKNVNKVAESIIKERKKSKFNSLLEVVERVKIQSGKQKRKERVISHEKMLELIDKWSKIFVKEN